MDNKFTPSDIIDNLSCGVFTVDRERRILSWNEAAERITGKSAEQILGHKCCELLCLNCFKNPEEFREDCPFSTESRQFNTECVISRPDGSSIRVLKSSRAIYSDSGEVIGAVETLTDISNVNSDYFSSHVENENYDTETQPVPGMIGISHPMREVYRLVRFAAESESTVLITGESGTGKELAARAIHVLSRRAQGPFVAVNCSALPENLLESELFGHVRGAFSGAVGDKVGRFELADKGTIFLDEIGDISPLIQLKLLRVIQEHEYQRVGESKSRKADVRIITATNRDLLSLVKKGEFREDLFFRLKVFPIRLPALREKKSDIPTLLDHFIDKFNGITGKNIQRMHPESMKLILEYCWPGNVRELEHAVEYAFVLCQGNEIDPYELPQEILRAEIRSQFCPQGASAIDGFPLNNQPPSTQISPQTRQDTDNPDLLRQVLDRFGWNQTRAAEQLGISRVTLWKKMKKYSIERPGN